MQSTDSTCLSLAPRDLPAAAQESKDEAAMLTLQANEASLVLAPESGGAIAGWTIGPHHVLRPALADALVRGVSRGMSAYPLVPFSNRINNGRFSSAGRSYQLARNFGDEPHAIHGVGWTSVWDIAELSRSAVLLALEYTAQGEAARGWPFPFAATLRFDLSPNELSVRLSVTNRWNAPAPAGLGLHPFFPRTEAAALRFAASHVWRTGADHMPTECVPVPPEWSHASPRRVGSAILDNLFEGWDGVAEIALAPSPIRVRVTASDIFRRCVVYVPPGRPYFAVEPVSHETDAINRLDQGRDTGLRILTPGETLAGEIRFVVS
jgi:aldose 1-epimerase